MKEHSNVLRTVFITRYISGLSIKKLLLLSFLLAFIVRLIPELFFPVPVGFDTAIYFAGAKNNPIPVLEFRLLQKFILPYVYHVLKIDLLFFMKIYAPIIHASITTLLLYYGVKVLNWKDARLIILLFLLTFSPAILRMAWDTHSQNLATLMLAGTILLMERRLSILRFFMVLPIIALIALSHQLVLVVGLAILLVEVIVARDRSVEFIIMIVFIVLSFLLVVVLNPLLLPSKAISLLMSMVNTTSSVTMTPQLIVLQGFTAIWYLIPCSIIGFFRDRKLLAWTMLTIIIFLTGLLIPNPGPLVPGRWITYSAYPLTFFAANSVVKNKLVWKKMFAIIFVSLTVFTGLNMLFPNGTSITLAMHEVYPEIPATLMSSTAKREHIEALIIFTSYLNSMDREACLVTHYPWFFWWAWYLYDGETLYNGPRHTNEQVLKSFVEKNVSRCGSIYLVWFNGLGWAREIMRIGELSLYEYKK